MEVKKREKNLADLIGEAIEKNYATVLNNDNAKNNELAKYIRRFFIFKQKQKNKALDKTILNELSEKLAEVVSVEYSLGIWKKDVFPWPDI